MSSLRLRPQHPTLAVRGDLSAWRWLLALALLAWPLGLSCGPGTPPILDEMQPKQAFTGKAAQLVIYGKSFPDGDPQVVLLGRSSQITLKDVKRVDDGKLEATLPKDAPPGPYDLQVTFGDREPLLLGGAFEVIAQALQIYFIEVGQGDATLLVSPANKTMLLDAGPPGQAPQIEKVLQSLQIRQLDHVIATHYDADHVGALEALVNGPDGKARTDDDHEIRVALWDPGGVSKNRSYSRVRSRFSTLNKSLDGASDASFPTIDLGGGVTVEVHAANGVVKTQDGGRKSIDCKDDANCRSIGTLIKIGKFRMWTAGDLTGGGNDTPDVETTLASSLGRVDIYRSHHHGSKTSSNPALIEALSPQVVVVSAGKDNPYCHPHAAIIAR